MAKKNYGTLKMFWEAKKRFKDIKAQESADNPKFIELIDVAIKSASDEIDKELELKFNKSTGPSMKPPKNIITKND